MRFASFRDRERVREMLGKTMRTTRSGLPLRGVRPAASLACLAWLALGLTLSAPIASAQLFHVTIDTSSLSGLGTHYLEFQLIDGSFAGDGNSRATISDFLLVGGTLGSVLPPTLGSVAGALPSPLTLVDGPAGSPLADFAQAFDVTDPVSSVGFDLELSASGIDGGIPDQFTFLILDTSLNPIATDGPVGVEFVVGQFTSLNPVPDGFGSNSPALRAVVTPVSGAAVPEPPSGIAGLAFLAITLALSGTRTRQLRRQFRASCGTGRAMAADSKQT